MLNRISRHFDHMALAVLTWMCTVPLVGLLVLPFFGLEISLLIALVLFISILVVCWGICSWKIFHS